MSQIQAILKPVTERGQGGERRNKERARTKMCGLYREEPLGEMKPGALGWKVQVRIEGCW